jgi:hypothetical protein
MPYPTMHSVNHEGERQRLLAYVFDLGKRRQPPGPLDLPVCVYVAQAQALPTGTVSKINIFRQNKSGLLRSCPALLAYACM